MTTDQVKEALACLYDPVELAAATLGRCFASVDAENNGRRRAQALRSLLLDAIEALQPHATDKPLTPAQRGYELLALHYVQRLSLAEAAEEMNVSVRQAYRDLAEATDKLTKYLADLAAADPSAPKAATEPTLREELRQIPRHDDEVDVLDAVEAAKATVVPLAEARRVRLMGPASTALPRATGNADLLRHLLVGLLSLAVRHGAGGEVRVEASAAEGEVLVRMGFAVGQFVPELVPPELLDLCQSQAARLDTSCRHGDAVILLSLPARRRRLVLVIEDNPGVVELYSRMLQDIGGYEVIAAHNAEEGLALASARRPDVIILDILMPGADGWAVLRALRQVPGNGGVPVVVCSVFDERELAMALGAAGYLKKPITQQQLDAALRACLRENHTTADG